MAEWVVGTDVERNGWGAMYLEKLIGHGVTSMSKAKELIEESGDLREWQIPKVAAKAMFATMVEYKLDDSHLPDVDAIKTAQSPPDTPAGNGDISDDDTDAAVPSVMGAVTADEIPGFNDDEAL